MTQQQTPGQELVIEQSDVLKEAAIESLTELFSRDPEGFTRQDRDRIVEGLRAQRENWLKAEQEAQAKGGKAKPKAIKAQDLLTRTVASAEDLGI
jgi:uncharacterized protein YdaU (DUF1376 family)